jgi:nitroimidazol reductase NimA-like FMN-containing flavoprotein (pyridoxamine 5'-phosphate oxidase superfamily)
VSAADSWEFLDEARIGVLSIARPDRAPHTSPMWYWVSDGGVEFTVAHASVKGRLLKERTPASLTVHTDAWPYRYVTVEGSAAVVRDRVVDDLRFVAVRYLGELLARGYVDSVKHGGLIVRLDVDKVTDVDFR